MIPKIDEKKRAIELRKSGRTYNEIRAMVKVSKSSLSLWLREIGMAKRQMRRISEKQRQSQKKAVSIVHEMRLAKTLKIKTLAAAEIEYLKDRERWLMGICLYWAEGSKEKEKGTLVKFSNSDPAMIIFFREWILDFLKVAPQDINYALYIHAGSANIASAFKYWVNILKIEPHELKICLKRHNPSPKRKNIGANYIGLVRLEVCKSTDLNRKISGWIDGIMRNANVIGE